MLRSDYYAEMGGIGYAKRNGYKGLEYECRVGMGISRAMILEAETLIIACACLLGHGPMPVFESWMIKNLEMDAEKPKLGKRKPSKYDQFRRIVARLILRVLHKMEEAQKETPFKVSYEHGRIITILTT